MSTPPVVPPERQSLYPEAHRVGEWAETPKRRSFAPLLIGAVVVLGSITVAIYSGLALGKSRGTETIQVTDPNGTAINAIQADPGTCLSDMPESGSVARVTAVPCNVAHHGEVVFTYTLSGGTWPGSTSVEEQVIAQCGAFIQPGFEADAMFKPGDWQDGLRWVVWLPTEDSWATGEKDGLCVVYRQGDIVGSFVAGTATFSN